MFDFYFVYGVDYDGEKKKEFEVYKKFYLVVMIGGCFGWLLYNGVVEFGDVVLFGFVGEV